MAYVPVKLVSWEEDIVRRMDQLKGREHQALRAALDIARELTRIRANSERPEKLEAIQTSYVSMVDRLRNARVNRRFVPQHKGVFGRAARSLAQQEQEAMERSGTSDESGKPLKIGSAVT